MLFIYSNSIHDHFGELVDFYILVADQVRVRYNLVDIRFVHFFTHALHSMLKVLYCNFIVMIRIENPKSIDEVLQSFLVFASLSYRVLQALKVEGARVLTIDFHLHGVDFVLSWVKIECSHQGSKLRGVDQFTSLLVKKFKYLLDLVGRKVAS